MRKILWVVGVAYSLLVLSVYASVLFAADVLPTKAPPSNPLFSGYPYSSSGFYFGLNTIGGGGSVNATGVGVNPASVVSNQIGVGLTLGYVYGNGNVFYAAEAMFDVQNFNGNAPGFSFNGPASFEQRIKIGTPLSNFMSLFPTLGLPSVPPFPALPNGQVATNVHPYLMAGIHEDDISVNFGLPGNRAWRVAPSLGAGSMGQLTKGVAVDVWAETIFPTSGICVGVPGGSKACGSMGQQYKIGMGLYY